MNYGTLTLERLKEVLDYDPATGVFRWKVRPYFNSRKYPGDIAGSLKVHGRAAGFRYISIDSRSYMANQLAWFYMTGEWAPGWVGMKNRDRTDLRFENLRLVPTGGRGHDFRTLEGRTKYRRAFREANPLAIRAYGFKRFYGITAEDYQRMFAEQKGVCAICSQPETATMRGQVMWLAVDHDHDTGAVRGLLCKECNSMIGKARDSTQILSAAIRYLDHHKKHPDAENVVALKRPPTPA